jgi:hypothetical protein
MPHVLSDTEHPMAFYKAEGPTIHRQPSETPGTLAGNYEPFPLAARWTIRAVKHSIKLGAKRA